ncbi:MAG TPA: protein-glutamate O-methyltransferase CheR [Candidatus Angelobacter sp.]|jgi:chemotaxis protein methyltransferase CheR|nr:protein-glutamate O-methyltransferase CheR [Candidatus Angelobacter sp.]
MSNQASEFAYLCELVETNAAIALDAQRAYLMEARLSSLAHQEGFATVSEFIGQLRAKSPSDLHWKVVEAMTTNETSFFRDLKPFEALRNVIIPQAIEARQKERSLNIWCPACSSGQEPYSVCMMLRDHFPVLQSWNIEVLASDISNAMLQKAQQGLYSQMEVNRGLPAASLVRHFKKEGADWRLNENIRKMVTLRRINLAGPWTAVPSVDIVLLRNVLIYFSVETKKQILNNMRQVLRPGGYLMLGTAETTINLDPNYRSEVYGNVCYYRPLICK